MFTKIAPERFAAFHRAFRADTWDVCARCGGKCEISRIGSLMPGEAEFIAASLGRDASVFRREFLDGIATPYGVVDVLKLKPGCPFLSPTFSCTLAGVKVVLCEIYPVAFDVRGAEVSFYLDSWCPMVRHVPELAEQFELRGIDALRALEAPDEWYRAVAMYDELCVDYDKLFALRAADLGYVTLTLEQVQECLSSDAPPPELALATQQVSLPLARPSGGCCGTS